MVGQRRQAIHSDLQKSDLMNINQTAVRFLLLPVLLLVSVLLGSVWLGKLPVIQSAAASTTLPATISANPFKASANPFANQPKFLPVEQAFGVVADYQAGQIRLRFKITPQHYIYQDRLKLQLPKGVVAQPWHFDQVPTMVNDPAFGKVAVFEQDVVASVMLDNHLTSPIESDVAITWQGCAKAGLCYPPERLTVRVALPAATKADAVQNEAVQSGVVASLTPNNATTLNNATPNNPTNTTGTTTTTTTALSDSNDVNSNTVNSNTDSLLSAESTNQYANQYPNTARYRLEHTPAQQAQDDFGLMTRPSWAVVLLFLAGVVLSFSACVYPMIPIVAHIVAKSQNPSATRGFWLTLAYGVGVATSYGILGALVAWFGRTLGILTWLQNPWLLAIFALFFVLLALQMMGLISLALPTAIAQRLSASSQAADRYLGSLGGSFLVGALSALVVSPCVSAPLAGALLAVSVAGNAWLGFVSLFALGLGLSLPLVVMGAAQGNYLPKAGAWMDDIKRFGGLMLLCVAIVLLTRIPWLGAGRLLLWAFWFGLVGVFLWRFGRLVLSALALLSFLWTACLVVGAAQANQDPWRPLVRASSPTDDLRLYSLAQLDEVLASNPKVLVDVTADWCVQCHVMEKELFYHRPQAMADWQLVRLDISQSNEETRRILARYQLFGPPALLYYQEGKLQKIHVGEVARADFEQTLARF